MLRPGDRSLPVGIRAGQVVDFAPFPSGVQMVPLLRQGADMAQQERIALGHDAHPPHAVVPR
eukprot:230269-Karenia_brevis.AAC.1